MTERTAASWTAWVFSGLAAIFSSACLAEEAKPQGRPVSAFDQTVPAAPAAGSDKAAASEPSDPGTAPARRPSETSNIDDKARMWKGLPRLHNYDDERRRGNPYATEESRRRRAGGAHEAQRRGSRRPGR